jgi:hypothetical protein
MSVGLTQVRETHVTVGLTQVRERHVTVGLTLVRETCHRHIHTSTNQQPEITLQLVLPTLTDINCTGRSTAAIPASTISFHFIHLTSVRHVVQADGASTEC